ncbi:MAG: Uncharacterized protein FD156_1230 [Nitrospirae bacterium]|nr:MAG: Uncharacterized protein FD156_1230 [Nitrospirota bacterium]
MSLLEKLKAGKKNKNTIKFPGTDQDIIISVLSEADIQAAHFESERLFKKNGIEVSMSTVDAYEAEKTTQILFRACSDTDGKPLSKTVDEFRSQILKAEKDILVDEYNSLEQECSPNPEKISTEDMEKIIDEVKKRPEMIGSVSNIVIARKLIVSLASRLQNSQQGSGSTSS